MERLVILGGGFAGVWAALSAARTRAEHGARATEVAVTLVSRDPWLTVRPRLYEASLEDVRVPLDSVLRPAGVERVEAAVTAIDARDQVLALDGAGGARVLGYERLILAAGSHVHRPAIQGLQHAFTVDTYADALALQRHLAVLPGTAVQAGGDARFTAVVVGAGFTGIETATELLARLQALAASAGRSTRVVMVESAAKIAPDLGAEARLHVERALNALGIERRVGRTVSVIEPLGARLDDGEWIAAATTVWTAGMRASPLTAALGVELDVLGRVTVDDCLRVLGVEGVYAAGDVARAMVDATHVAPMSCQHAIPMGDRAGRNAVAELLGASALPYSQPSYVTCLDLGAAGALFTQGWEREVQLTGFWAKMMKKTINTRMIYPPAAQRVDPGSAGRRRSAA